MKFILDDGGRQNAGYKGTTGDCVTRAIAIASEQPYEKVYDSLNKVREGMRQTKRVRVGNSRTGCPIPVLKKYLEQLGWAWTPLMWIGSGCKVHLRDGELPMGRLIVRCSRHLAAVIDGVLHDNHDSSRDGTRCVYGYWRRETNPQTTKEAVW